MLKYDKKITGSQIDRLLSHTSSENPLWLTVACEELVQYNSGCAVDDRINCFPEGILK